MALGSFEDTVLVSGRLPALTTLLPKHSAPLLCFPVITYVLITVIFYNILTTNNKDFLKKVIQ